MDAIAVFTAPVGKKREEKKKERKKERNDNHGFCFIVRVIDA